MNDMRKVFVRADGNEKIGMGHLMRTLTIMDQMDHSKAEITYLCATERGAELVIQKGYRAELLSSDYQKPEEEVKLLKPLLKKAAELSEPEPLILVDTYYVTDDYLQFLAGYGTVVLLDDMMQRAFPVDGVINYNAFAQEEWYSAHYPQKKRWIGSSYVPLREEFNDTPKANPFAGNEILITTGGGDLQGACDPLPVRPAMDVGVVVSQQRRHPVQPQHNEPDPGQQNPPQRSRPIRAFQFFHPSHLSHWSLLPVP